MRSHRKNIGRTKKLPGKIGLAVFFGLLQSCADPCAQPDFIVDGLCVNANGFDFVQADEIAQTLEIVSFNVRERLREKRKKDFNLSRLIRDNGAGVFYVEDIPNKDDRSGEYHYFDSSINVEGVTRDPVKGAPHQCWESYFVLGHEILHLIDHKFFGANGGHKTPYVWEKWAEKNDYDHKDTIEGRISYHVDMMCLDMYW